MILKSFEEKTPTALIAGGGPLPGMLMVQEPGVFCIGLKGQAEPDLTVHASVRIGALGTILDILNANAIERLIFLGSVKRPTLTQLMPDLTALELVKNLTHLGDDGLLRGIIGFFEIRGFQVIGAQEVCPSLLAPQGHWGGPSLFPKEDIARGQEVLEALGRCDIGQSVVIQEGLVLGVETIEGTASFLHRIPEIKKNRRLRRGGVLIKRPKPNQDLRFDLPTIGPDTIEDVQKAGLVAVVVEAGNTFIINRAQVEDQAQRYKIALWSA